MKRILSMVITFAMLLCMFPTCIFAQTDIIAECNIADGENYVSNPNLTEKVTVTFNQPMDTTTLNATNVQLVGGDYVTQYTVDDNNKSISYDICYLRPNTKYTLTLKSKLKSADGNLLGEDKVISTFTTGEIYVANGDESLKIQNVSINKKITTPDGMASDSHKIGWLVDGVSGNMPHLTKDLNEDGRRSFTIDLEEEYVLKAVDLSLHNGYQGYNNWKIFGHNTENADVNEMTLLADTTDVNIAYKSDVGGYRIFLDNNESFRYITCSRGGSVYTYEVSVWAGINEEELPIEAECNIEDGRGNVENPNLSERVTVTFNQPMDASTLNSNYVLLTEKDWTRIAQYEVNDELTEISFGMEYLNPNKTYTLKIKNGIKNEDGIALENDIELCTFTTGNIIVDETADGEKFTNVSMNKTVISEGTGDTSIITDGSQGYRFDGVDVDNENAAHFTIDLEDSYNVKAADMVLHGGYGGFNYWKVYGHNESNAKISEMTELAQTPHQWITHATEGASYRIFLDNNEEYRYITFVRASNSFWIYECTVWANAAEDIQEPDVPGGDVSGDDNGGQTPEIPTEIIAECNIENGATGVENPNLTEKVTVTFNQPMDSATLNTNYVYLAETSWNRLAQYEVNDELTEISFGMEYLNPNKTYTLKIKDGIKSADGKILEEAQDICTFTTGNIIVDETDNNEKLTKVSLNKTVTAEGSGNTAYITNGSQGERFDGVDEDRENAAHFTIDLEDSYNLQAADLSLHGGYGGFNLWKVYGHNESDADISEMVEIGQSPQDAWIPHASEGATYRIFFNNNEKYRYITFVRASNSFWIYECTVWANVVEEIGGDDIPDNPDTPPSVGEIKIVKPVNDAEYISNGGTASMTSPTGHKLLLCKSGAYITWSVDIPRDGVYLISFFSAYRGSNPRVTTHIDTGDGFVRLGEQEIIQGETVYTAMENPVCAVPLKKGTIKVKLTESYYEAFMSDLVISTYEDFVLTNVKAGKQNVVNGDAIERSTDYFDLTFNRNVNPDTVSGITLSSNERNLKSTAYATDNTVRIYLEETLDYSTEYSLNLDGVKDAYSVYEINESFSTYITKAQDGTSVYKSKGTDKTRADINYNVATVTGIALSSEGKPIKGRKVYAYLKDTNGHTTQEPVAQTISGGDGLFTIIYTIPELSESGVYTFIIEAEYADSTSEETVIYVSKTKEAEIVSSFESTTDWQQTEALIDTYKEILNINPETDLVNIPIEGRDRLYRHFVNKRFDGFMDFLTEYDKVIAFETLNQATTADTVKIILDSENSCKDLGVDKKITDCIVTEDNRNAFLGALADISILDTIDEYLAEFDKVLNKYLSKEFGKDTPAMIVRDSNIFSGEGVALELEFADNVTDVKDFVYEITDVNNSGLFNKAYVTLNIKGTYELTKNASVYTLRIIPESIVSRTKNVGTLYLTSGSDTGSYNLNINGYIIHSVRRDYGDGNMRYESKNTFIPSSLTINVTNSNQSSSGMISSSTPIPGMSSSSGGGGGGGISTPVITPPATETEYSFTDMPKGHWAEESVNTLLKLGVISKPENKAFNPEKEVSREEFIKMVVIAFDMWDKNATGNSFDDVTIDNWYYSYVYSAQKNGIITGNGLGFGAGDKITREDMSVILSRIMNTKGIIAEHDGEVFADNSDIADYAQNAVYAMKKLGIINGVGDNLFNPKGNATRAMAAKVIYELTKLTQKSN